MEGVQGEEGVQARERRGSGRSSTSGQQRALIMGPALVPGQDDQSVACQLHK